MAILISFYSNYIEHKIQVLSSQILVPLQDEASVISELLTCSACNGNSDIVSNSKNCELILDQPQTQQNH